MINYLQYKSVGKRKGMQGAKIQRSEQILKSSTNRCVYFEFLYDGISCLDMTI